MKFNKGDIVRVKLAGLYLTGTVKTVKLSGDCIIQFESGNEQEILARNIKLIESSKTPQIETSAPKLDKSEKKTTGRHAKSPTRRSPARNVSPSRRTRASPSPSRKKSSTVISSPAPKAQTTTTRILKVSLENIENSIGDTIETGVSRRRKLEDADTAASSAITSTVNKSELLLQSPINDHLNFHNVRSREYSRKPDRILFMRQTDNMSKVNDIGKFSDDDENIYSDRKKELKSTIAVVPHDPREFAGWFGALLLIVLIPCLVIALQIFCNKDSCTYRKLPNFRVYKTLQTYFDLKSSGIYCAYIMLIAILSHVPFVGRRINSQPSKENMYTYYMNGLFSAFTVLALVVGLEALNKPIVNYIVDKYFQLMMSAIAFGFILSIFLFIKSKFAAVSQLNPYAVTYNLIYDFFMGRQINPRLFGFDIKIILLRASYIAILILNSIYVFKSMNIVVIDPNDLMHWDNYRLDLEPALLVASFLQMLYVLDILAFESNLTTTFELQYEGLGYMKLLQYSVYPFLMTSITKYLYEHASNVQENPLILATICLVYSAGYILYRGSNSQKNAFRLNPYDTAFQQMNTLQTGKGKKLLISGFWGKLRHPNYLGDILIHLAVAACAAGSPASLSTLPVTFLLAYRAARDNNRCKQRYSIAWERYSHKVKYAIIPKIY